MTHLDPENTVRLAIAQILTEKIGTFPDSATLQWKSKAVAEATLTIADAILTGKIPSEDTVE